jgi:hypothetical protein
MGFHGGNLTRLLNDLIHRSFQPLLAGEPLQRAQALSLPAPVPASTGPP